MQLFNFNFLFNKGSAGSFHVTLQHNFIQFPVCIKIQYHCSTFYIIDDKYGFLYIYQALVTYLYLKNSYYVRKSTISNTGPQLFTWWNYCSWNYCCVSQIFFFNSKLFTFANYSSCILISFLNIDTSTSAFELCSKTYSRTLLEWFCSFSGRGSYSHFSVFHHQSDVFCLVPIPVSVHIRSNLFRASPHSKTAIEYSI